MKRLCTICARGGSKGVKNKNVRTLNGLPLIAHTILQAQSSELFSEIAVSSDSTTILDIAKSYGIQTLIQRSLQLSTENAAKIPAIVDCVTAVENQTSSTFDTIVDLDVTSPLREIEDIKNAVFLLETAHAQNVVTGCPSRRSPYFNMVEVSDTGTVKLVNPPSTPIVRRQDAPKTYDLNASIYVWNRDFLLSNQTLFHKHTLLYIMPQERSVDIDSELDFEFVDFLMKKRRNESI